MTNDDLDPLPTNPSGGPSADESEARRPLLQLAAVIAAIALCVMAWASLRSAEAEEDQACLARAEMTALARGNMNFDIEEVERAFALCGLRITVPKE